MPVTFLLNAASADAPWVDRITGVLDDLGFRWRRVAGRDELALDAMRDGTPAVLVTVLSPAFFTEPETRDSWPVADAMAARGRLRLLPIQVARTPLPPPLRDYPYVDLSDAPSATAAVERLRHVFGELNASDAHGADRLRPTHRLRVAVVAEDEVLGNRLA